VHIHIHKFVSSVLTLMYSTSNLLFSVFCLCKLPSIGRLKDCCHKSCITQKLLEQEVLKHHLKPDTVKAEECL
jgi:hypothetical protein